MSGGSQPQTQTTTQMLSPEQRQLLNLAMPGVTQFAASVPQRYQGSQVAGFDPSQTAGQNMALGAAGNQKSLADSGLSSSLSWLSPQALDVNNNPAIQGLLDKNARAVNDNLLQTTLPAIRDSAERTGNFGSSRQGIAEGIAQGKAAAGLADANATTLNNAYNENVDAQLKTLGLLPSTIGTQTAPATTTSGVGDVRQALDQSLLSQDVNNFNYDQYAPFLQSQDIISLLTGLPGGSTQTVASTPQKNMFTSALGGAAAGASLGSAILPGVGTGVGAGIGGLLAFL